MDPLSTFAREPTLWERILARLLPEKRIKRVPTAEDLKDGIKMDDHIIPLDELCSRLNSNPTTGLSLEIASKRLAEKGKNSLTPPEKPSLFTNFLLEIFKGFGPIMLIGALSSIGVYFMQIRAGDAPLDNVYVFLVLLVVLLLTTAFSVYQKNRSAKIMDSFKKMVPESARVLRSHNWCLIPADELVIGDIVSLQGGDRIPADLRVLSSQSFKVDNSSLTGETDPQPRSLASRPDPLRSPNMCFYTTNALEGTCEAIVIRIGDKTVMGRIAKLTSIMKSQPTPIGREIAHCVRIICCIALGMGALYITVAFLVGVHWLNVISLSVGLMVGNMPGGLLIMVTAMLALTSKRMGKKNCLVKNLEAVESLGSCSVICTDKTGTLTQNRMTVSSIWIDDTLIPFEHRDLGMGIRTSSTLPSMDVLFRTAALCNRAKFQSGEDCKPVLMRKVDGDASETAILKFIELITGSAAEYRINSPVVAEVPFNSTNKYQLSIHSQPNDEYLLVMKGAPEVILSRCSTILVNGCDLDLSLSWRERAMDACMEFAKMGERVIAFCDMTLPKETFSAPYPFDTEAMNFPIEGLRFIGHMSMLDPPRATVPDAIAKCRSAGIRVIMVTGDHPVTATAIARSVGIISHGSFTAEEIAASREIQASEVHLAECQAAVVRGDQLQEMSDQSLWAVLCNHPELVFARTSPQQKLRIVDACQRLGAIVAVTGDGVNDSPALRKADIGVAMGITGSDVSKQAADMILLDDNFSSIVSGIEEGRLIFDNIKKTCCYAMTTDVPEIAPVVMYVVLNIPLGLYTISMLLLNCVTDLAPAISLAYEPVESNVMKLPPRSPKEHLITSNLVQAVYLQIGIIESVGAFLVYFIIYGTYGWFPGRLIGLRAQWDEATIIDLRDSYGQEWTHGQRKHLESMGNAGFFLATVVQNVVHLLVRRCRRESLFVKGFTNHRVLYAIVFELALACTFVYSPGFQDVLGFSQVMPYLVLPVLPFLFYILFYDEMRRFVVSEYPSSWAECNLFI